MSLTFRPPTRLPAGAAEAEKCGAFLTRHPEKQSAAPDITPVRMKLRREIATAGRWFMSFAPALLGNSFCEGKQGSDRSQAASCGAALLPLNVVREKQATGSWQ